MRRRFLIALALAILPFALLGSGQAIWRLIRTYDEARVALTGAADAEAAREAAIVTRAEGVLDSLGTQPDIRSAGPACDAALASALATLGDAYTNIARVNADGRVVCSAVTVDASITDRSAEAWWSKLQREKRFILGSLHRSAISGEAVIIAAFPLPEGGALALGLKQSSLGDVMRGRTVRAGALVALVDEAGQVVSATDQSTADALFAGGAQTGDSLGDVRDASGAGWRYARAPINKGDLAIVFAQRDSTLFRWSYVDVAANVALPLIIAAFAFWAIRASADRFVLRWIVFLQRVSKAYGGGHYALRSAATAQAERAPEEIVDLAQSMDEMADRIRERDSHLRSAVEQRDLMLREIHHRIKNNLQVIGSLVHLESRRLTSPEARAALTITLARINAVALVHRLLEEAGSETVVNLSALLRELAPLAHEAFAGEYAHEIVDVHADQRRVSTDSGVPLALYVVEAFSEIYATAAAQKPTEVGLSITLRDERDAVVLEISSLAPLGSAQLNSFMTAYQRQLMASADIAKKEGRDAVVLRFSAPLFG